LAVDECGAFPVVKNEKYQHIETHVTEGHIKNFVSRMSALPALMPCGEVFFCLWGGALNNHHVSLFKTQNLSFSTLHAKEHVL
jgi:hypothetical protein